MALIRGTKNNDKLLGGALDDRIEAGQGDDRLYGNAGNDLLFGGDGKDYLSGGTGNDRLEGNRGDDVLRGGSGKDELNGGAGNDKLYGDAGDDRIFGGGGPGADDMSGGLGADRFIFKSLTDSTVATAGRDDILDFSISQHDLVDLRGIDAKTDVLGDQSFTFIGKTGFHGKEGELRYVKTSSDTYIYGDVDGDKKADFAIHLDDAVTLSKDCFLL